MSHVIPQTVLQTLKLGRCNSNVFRACRKLTKINYVRVFEEERLPPAREIAAHPHGSPQMSHVIPQTVLQTLKLGRCNSNVFRAYRKLTKGNYVRHFRGVRVLPATRPGLARRILSRIVVARNPRPPPSHRWGLPGTAPLHSRERPARRQRSYERSGEPCRPLTGRPWMGPCRRTRPHHETRARRRCRPRASGPSAMYRLAARPQRTDPTDSQEFRCARLWVGRSGGPGPVRTRRPPLLVPSLTMGLLPAVESS